MELRSNCVCCSGSQLIDAGRWNRRGFGIHVYCSRQRCFVSHGFSKQNHQGNPCGCVLYSDRFSRETKIANEEKNKEWLQKCREEELNQTVPLSPGVVLSLGRSALPSPDDPAIDMFLCMRVSAHALSESMF